MSTCGARYGRHACTNEGPGPCVSHYDATTGQRWAGQRWGVVLGAAPPSPRASLRTIQELMARNMREQAGDVAGRILNIDKTYEELGIALVALAASEKERERLKAIVDAKCDLNDAALLDERNRLRRELENLKRANDCFRSDATANIARLETLCKDDALCIDFLQRELDRERAKNKKRGP